MRRVSTAAAVGGIVFALCGGAGWAAEAGGSPAVTGEPQATPGAAGPTSGATAAAAPAAAPAPAQPAAVGPATVPGQEQAPAQVPAPAASQGEPGKPPCAGGPLPPWAGRPYGWAPRGYYGGPWSRPMPPRPPFPAWEEGAGEDEVSVQTDADEANYYVIVHLAGLDPDKVQVQVRRRGLVVSSGLGWERSVMGPGAWERETKHRYFHEFLTLPWDADVSRLSREVRDDGTLRIVIPRRGR